MGDAPCCGRLTGQRAVTLKPDEVAGIRDCLVNGPPVQDIDVPGPVLEADLTVELRPGIGSLK